MRRTKSIPRNPVCSAPSVYGRRPVDHKSLGWLLNNTRNRTRGASLKSSNLWRLHRSKNNHQKFIVIGQIIGSGQIDSFMGIESVIASISIYNRNIISLNWMGRLNIESKYFSIDLHKFVSKKICNRK